MLEGLDTADVFLLISPNKSACEKPIIQPDQGKTLDVKNSAMANSTRT